MPDRIPDETIRAFARTVGSEAAKYGFEQVDFVRFINALIEVSTERSRPQERGGAARNRIDQSKFSADSLPASSERLRIRAVDIAGDMRLIESWINDDYGAHFLLSSSSAQRLDPKSLIVNPQNEVGIIEKKSGEPIGAMAFLDIDRDQQRAELRKLIGSRSARGQGFAEEATALWTEYGFRSLQLEKIFVSTLQTHIRNIQLNESVGFNVEGLLRREVRLGSERHDVLRMGLCRDQLYSS